MGRCLFMSMGLVVGHGHEVIGYVDDDVLAWPRLGRVRALLMPSAMLQSSWRGIEKVRRRYFPPRPVLLGGAAQALQQQQQQQQQQTHQQQAQQEAAAKAEALAAAAKARARAIVTQLADEALATRLRSSSRLSLLPGPQYGIWPPDWSAEYEEYDWPQGEHYPQMLVSAS